MPQFYITSDYRPDVRPILCVDLTEAKRACSRQYRTGPKLDVLYVLYGRPGRASVIARKVRNGKWEDLEGRSEH